MSTLTLTKHQGLGNDFLVLVDLDGRHELTPVQVRRLCDRHLGVGADGLVRVTRGEGDADVSMDLYNSDGSRAEMSGNGIRCLAQAVLDQGVVAGRAFVVGTGAGPRDVIVLPSGDSWRCRVSVSMGPVEVGEEMEHGTLPGHRAREVRLGNPHVVVLEGELAAIDLPVTGVGVSNSHGGANVEFMDVESSDEVTIRTWERGAGETLACGTGSVAAAAAARAWGLVGDRVRVRNPGGSMDVDLSGEGAVLEGPVELVARVEACLS